MGKKTAEHVVVSWPASTWRDTGADDERGVSISARRVTREESAS